jgi:hypothetical protein
MGACSNFKTTVKKRRGYTGPYRHRQ